MAEGDQGLQITGGTWAVPMAAAPVAAPVLELPAGDGAEGGNQPYIVLVGAQTRADVPAPQNAPYAGLVLIEFFYRNALVRLGTGFFIEPTVIITARHNLEPDNFDSSGVWRGYDTQHNPAGPPITIRSNARHPTLDLAVLVTMEASPTAFQMASPAAPPGTVSLAGYAMPYENGAARLSKASGPASFGANDLIGYHISTRPGDSGAPIFTTQDAAPVALGVHTEAPVGTPNMNAGVRFTPSVVAEVGKLIAFAKGH